MGECFCTEVNEVLGIFRYLLNLIDLSIKNISPSPQNLIHLISDRIDKSGKWQQMMVNKLNNNVDGRRKE
jgi:hypothetical protein